MDTRQQRQLQLQRPSYSQHATRSSPPSASSSVFQSSSSLSSLSPINTSTALSMPSHPGLVSAPMPSPSSNQPMSYFAPLVTQAPIPHSQQQLQQQAQRLPIPQPTGGAFLGQRGNGGGTPETAPLLKDFSLLAEAAKRAQMACLMRDLDDVEL